MMKHSVQQILTVVFFLVLGLLGGWVFGQDITDLEAIKAKGKQTLSSRAKKIFDRSQVLTANVVNVSKGAKGVGSPIAEREKWTAIAVSPAFKRVIAEAEKLQKDPIPEPSEEDYMRFYETASKTEDEINRDYEHKFNLRRHRLFRLVLAECFENKGRFIRDIEETVLMICMEPNWTVPSEDDGAKKFKGESKVIDRQIAQTAWNLATVHYWLHRKLSGNIRNLINDSIRARVFSVFEEAVLTDNYDLIAWANDAGHTNAICHAAVVGSALALIDSADIRAKYIASSEINVEKFLQLFTRDGYFPDGIWAWNEGFGSTILLAELLYQATGGRIDMLRRPSIKETALYGVRTEIVPGVFESFGNRYRGERPVLFPAAFVSKRFQMGLTEIENRTPFFGVGPGPLYMVGIYCFPNSATERKGASSGKEVPPLETFRNEFPLNGVMILRTGKTESNPIGVQLKGGNNDERNNHSDVGTYVVAINGEVPLCDIGARYNRRGLVIDDLMKSNLVNSFGHPVPRINEHLQKNGKGTTASLLLREYTDEKDTLKFDLQYVYDWKDPKDVKELTRTFIFDRTGKDPDSSGKAMFSVIDRFRGRKPVTFENCLITFGPFKMLTEDNESPTRELIVGEGRQALHIVVSNEVVEIDKTTNKFVKRGKALIFEAGALDEPIPRVTKVPFRLSFGFEEPVDEVTLTVKIRPAAPSKRNLAKNSPGTADRIYTSPIDDQVLVEEVKEPEGEPTSGGDEETAGNPEVAVLLKKYDALIDEFIKNSPIPIEVLKKMSDEELKTQFRQIKQTHPMLKTIPDEQDDAIIKMLRSKVGQ
ncbi:MAG: hypothetical protein LBG58_06585 [Planctomycetaceae bacterium]|jgi:hypothetical protein|nr:hypothetical protein [Planctomycetaceae bacterium]